jgi:glutathione S-transferase
VSHGPYLVGNAFTAADLYLGSHIGFGLQFGMIEQRPAFEQYVAHLMARPAAVRAKQIDDAPAS